MRPFVLGVTLLCSAIAMAKDRPVSDYQEGVLVSSRVVTIGSSCSSHADTDIQGTSDNTATARTTGHANCSDIRKMIYRISSGESVFELEPMHSKGAVATAFLPMGAAFLKNSSLANRLPGTHVMLRADGSGVFVKVDKRETRYQMVGSH
jgi:hypothetical protein